MEILCNASAYVTGAISVPVILGVVCWVTRTRVDVKTCDRTHQADNIEHTNLRSYIKDAEERAEKRHSELVNLIKNGGQSKPRIRT